VGAPFAGQLNVWALPAIAIAAVAGGTLVVVSGSPASLAVLGTIGLPEISAQRRAHANGLIWAGVGLLMVHFTAPAFEPVPGGPILAGLVFAAGLGIGTTRLHLAAIDHEAYRSFNLVAMLLAAGSLASMSITPTGEWWAHNFSTLGTSDDFAAACFNVAVTMSGLGMALLGPALTSALRAERFGVRRGGLTTIRVLIAFIGVSLMGVGIVPIDGATLLHNLFACGAAAGFAVIAVGVQLWAKRMPRALVIFSYGALAIEVSAMVAYDGLKVFNLTVFEIVAFTLVFAWLIALVALTARTEPSPAVEGASTPSEAVQRRHRVPLRHAGSLAATHGASPFARRTGARTGPSRGSRASARRNAHADARLRPLTTAPPDAGETWESCLRAAFAGRRQVATP